MNTYIDKTTKNNSATNSVQNNSKKVKQLRAVQLVADEKGIRPNKYSKNEFISTKAQSASIVQRTKFNPNGKTFKVIADPNFKLFNENSFKAVPNSLSYPAKATILSADQQGGGSKTSDIITTDYQKWFDKRLLLDQTQSKVQTVTKMHAINSHLHGPNQADNIFLGNASSNDYHSEMVEEPIKKFVGQRNGELHLAEYTVTPQYNIDDNHYNMKLANSEFEDNNLTKTEYDNFKVWAKNALPTEIDCEAHYYKKDKAGIWYQSDKDSDRFHATLTNFVKTGGWGHSTSKKKKDPLALKGRRKRAKLRPLQKKIIDAIKVLINDTSHKQIYKYIKHNHTGDDDAPKKKGVLMSLKSGVNSHFFKLNGGIFSLNLNNAQVKNYLNHK